MHRHEAALARTTLSHKELLAALNQGLHECAVINTPAENDPAMMLLSYQLGFTLNAPLVETNLDKLERACTVNAKPRQQVH